ncbi:MAG: glycosyltransferase family 39 protein [Candidatus Omnitrophica bacterium]|nr:glycosyltransferase family 39 protein [Candidatus Omnitrophota bacterium]
MKSGNTPLVKSDVSLTVIIGAIIFCALSAHMPGLGHNFKTLDERAAILGNPAVQEGRLNDIFTRSYFGLDAYYRPLVSLSYMLENQLFGDGPYMYYVTNLFLHALVSVIVFFIFNILFKERKYAFFGGLLFAIHPIHWAVVGNVTARTTLLYALCGGTCLWMYMCYHQTRRFGYWGLSFAAFLGALLSRETAMMLPAVLLAYNRLNPGEKSAAPRKLITEFAPYVAAVIVLLVIRGELGVTAMFQHRTAAEIWLAFSTFLKGNLILWRAFLLPYDLHFDRALSIDPRILQPAIFITMTLLTFTAGLLILFHKKIPKPVWFLLLFYALEMFPVSQLPAAVLTQPGMISLGEHFFYWPSLLPIALIVFIARGAINWGREKNLSRKLITAAVATLLFTYFSVTFLQQKVAQDPVRLHQQSILRSPQNTRMRYAYTHYLYQANQFEEVKEQLETILKIQPGHIPAKIGLGKVLCDMGQCQEALNIYDSIGFAGRYQALLDENIKRTIELILDDNKLNFLRGKKSVQNFYQRGEMSARLGRIQEAIGYFEMALDEKPNDPEVLFRLGTLSHISGACHDAVIYYERVLGQPELHLKRKQKIFQYLADCYAKLGDLHKAEYYRGIPE